MIRVAGNRGGFYPDSCAEVEEMIAEFNEMLVDTLQEPTLLSKRPRAIIVPHAGYIYSGFTANIAHRMLGNREPKRVIVIGPSHHVYFRGISGSMLERYETPCGYLPIDRAYLETLSVQHPILFVPEAHQKEHSTETQMPFVKHYLPHAKVIELIYGADTEYGIVASLIDEVLRDPANAVVISSDLSHFYTQKEAQKLDKVCLSGVVQKDIEILDHGCEACGIIGIKAMIEVARKQEFQVKLLDYRTSADVSDDRERVVGYMSAAFYPEVIYNVG